jgi:two-component system OmpR family response regulator
MRVLLVEDDPMIGRGLIEALGEHGFSVDWVRDGEDAVAALTDRAHALVLLDLGLPDAHGLDLLRDARREGLDAPVLVITARDGLDDRVAGLDLGADDYLAKPFEMRELLARMRAVLRRHQGRSSLRLVAGEEVESNAVDVLIHSIRRKFGKDVIYNVRGAGWLVPKSRS